jgi:hypothetical protein
VYGIGGAASAAVALEALRYALQSVNRVRTPVSSLKPGKDHWVGWFSTAICCSGINNPILTGELTVQDTQSTASATMQLLRLSHPVAMHC